LPVDHRAGKQTVQAWADRWHATYAPTVKPSTATKSRGLLDTSVIPLLGQMRIRDVTPATVAEFVMDVSERTTKRGPITPATIRHHYLALSNVLQYAAQNRAINSNPAKGVRLPTNRSQQRHARKPLFLTPEQVAKLADALPHPYGLLVSFLAFTGVRVGECAGLNIEDVDLENGLVHVVRTRTKVKGGWSEGTTKNNNTRTTTLPLPLAKELRVYVMQHPRGWPGGTLLARPEDDRADAAWQQERARL
jgi:integrase